MTRDYNKSRALAEKLISKFGYAGEFSVKGEGGGYNDDGTQKPSLPDTVISGTITPALSYRNNEIDGELIKATDGYVFFHSEDEPPIGATTIIDGATYRLMSIKKLTGNSINVYRKLQIRR